MGQQIPDALETEYCLDNLCFPAGEAPCKFFVLFTGVADCYPVPGWIVNGLWELEQNLDYPYLYQYGDAAISIQVQLHVPDFPASLVAVSVRYLTGWYPTFYGQIDEDCRWDIWVENYYTECAIDIGGCGGSAIWWF